MKQYLLLFIFLFALPLLSSAQYDSIVNDFKKEFEQFKQSATQKHAEFINQNDSIFIEFLKQSWETVRVINGKVREESKPVIQPVAAEKAVKYELKLIQPKKVPSLIEESNNHFKSKKLVPVKYESYFVISKLDFYGTNEEVYYSPQHKPQIAQVSVDNIIAFYSHLSKNSKWWEGALNQLLNAKKKYKLNDWGYYQLVKSAASEVFGEENAQRLFCWYLLLKSGFNVKVGYNKSDIFLLIPSMQELYNVPYLRENEHSYYILDKPERSLGNIKTYNNSHPESRRFFSFRLSEYPNFNGEPIKRSISYKGEQVFIQFERGVIDFLDSYPHCELKTYFNNRLSENIFANLDKLLNPFISNKDNREIVDELLHFCQTALAYKTDKDQFGKERYLFAEESLFYPYSDCEDRTVLLATLIQRYTNLTSVALDFPGHVALAVHFNNDPKGIFVTYNQKRYEVCDPTYINARSGMLPKHLKSTDAEIIDFYN